MNKLLYIHTPSYILHLQLMVTYYTNKKKMIKKTQKNFKWFSLFSKHFQMHLVNLHHLEIFLCVFASACLSRFQTFNNNYYNECKQKNQEIND